MNSVKKGLSSSLLLMAESILKKLVGLISTLILARVLVPEDFGLVAIASIVIGLLDVLAQTGAMLYLLRADKVTDDMVNTSWTINGILKISLTLILIVSTPYISEYYGDYRLNAILYVFATMIVLSCFANPGNIYHRIAQNYTPIIKLAIFGKFISVIVAISIALIYQNYWALILGQYTGAIIGTIGSYFTHPHRPKPCLSNAKEQWKFSGWMLPQGILGYARTQLDTFLVSSIFGKSELGSYHVMKYLAFIPSAHIVLPATQPLLVELSKVKHSKEFFSKQFNISFIITMLIAVPISILMFSYSELVTHVFLGDKWLKYENILAAFAILIPASAILNQGRRVLVVYALAKKMFYFELISFSTIYGTLFFVGVESLEFFTYVRVLLELIICSLFLIFISLKYTSFRNTVKFILTSSPVFIFSWLSVCICNLILPPFGPPLLQLFMIGVLFLILMLIQLFISYKLILNRSDEWLYIGKLISQITNVILVKVKKAKV
jgi:O-antigen/teichoic acid export membrane protein